MTAGIIADLTGLISSVLFFAVVILLIVWAMRRNHHELPAGQADLELERRRASMAEAEVRALRSANLELHQEVDRLRHQLGQVEQS